MKADVLKKVKLVSGVLVVILLLAAGIKGVAVYRAHALRNIVLKQMLERLRADSRIAEVMVTEVKFNPITQEHMTTIKFLEYDAQDRPMWPKYFTFNGNVIQFQSLVVRFDDSFVQNADALRGKSVYLFWKVFRLDGKQTQEYTIAEVNDVPDGYKVDGPRNDFEEELWLDFWEYALDNDKAVTKGIKNAQIEAPGMKFVPGLLYTLKIEHDGGIRIDAKEIPSILKGERL